MSKDAAPCIVCNRPLENVFETSDNQPEDGLAFQTHGHYGSTVFDPMDGQYLEVNICDPCLLERADRVLWSRDTRLVLCNGRVVGHENVKRPLVPWNKDGTGDDKIDVVNVPEEEVGQPLPNVEWYEPFGEP